MTSKRRQKDLEYRLILFNLKNSHTLAKRGWLFLILEIYGIISIYFGNKEKDMADCVELKDLFIGVPDGAMEAQNENFKELFYDPNSKYDELINNDEKFLVIGNKGTGKTYLANYILAKSPKGRVYEIVDGNGFSIYRLSNITEGNFSNDLILDLCKWFLMDKMSHLLLKKHPIKSRINFTSLGKLRKLVEQYDNYSFFKQIKIVSNSGKEIENLSNTKTKASKGAMEQENAEAYSRRKTRAFTVESERKQFYELINSYEELFFKCLSKNDDLMLIVDDLDELEKEEQKTGNIIIGLINAAKEYNLRFKKSKGKEKIVLLLRSDILNELQVQNANLSKTKTSCSVELYWLFDSMKEQYEHPLMSMVLHKIKATSPVYCNYSNKELFMKLFPEKIDSKRPLDYLLDYGFGRPRDIITFLNHAKTEFPNETCFSAKILKEARKHYSSDFYNEMLNQASFHKSPEYILQCMNLISAMKSATFYYDRISKVYEANKERYSAIDNLDDALSFMYKIGAIGNVWKIGVTFHTCWAYKKDAMDEIDLNKKFTIHYGLRKKFSL